MIMVTPASGLTQKLPCKRKDAAGQRIGKPRIIAWTGCPPKSCHSPRPSQKDLVCRAQPSGLARLSDQIRPQTGGESEALLAPPAFNLRVMTRQQHLRHGLAGPLLWPRVVRAIEQTVQ